jgi:NADPH2:quinone reductase
MSESTGYVLIEQTGGPEVMQWKEAPIAAPAANEVQVRHEAIGVDFIDTQLRSGILPVNLPSGLGFAGVGTVTAVGGEVSDIKAGQRIAYHYAVPGSYSEVRNVPAGRAFVLPDQNLDPTIAAGALFRGLTAWYLSTRLRDVNKGDWVLVHAAAGGVGLILCQWLNHLGANVIGTTDSAEKLEVLKQYGCKYPINLNSEDFLERTKQLTNGVGVSIVYESIGKATFERSLDCLKRFGLMASFGWPSGDVEPIQLAHTRNKGSLFLTRPTISHYIAEDADFKRGAAELYGLISEGVLKIRTEHCYPLKEAGRAHDDLANGRTTGSVVLQP